MKKNTLSLALLPFLLLGCSTDEKTGPRLCPQTAVLRELGTVKDYGRDSVQNDATLVAEARMGNIDGACHYGEKGVDVDFSADFAALKGPRLGSGHVSFPFFIAVVSPEGKILNKEMATSEIVFKDGEARAEKQDSFHVFIPLSDASMDASSYQVLMGYQLTEEQLEAKRAEEKARIQEELEKK